MLSVHNNLRLAQKYARISVHRYHPEQIMFADKHTGIFSRHIEVIVYLVQTKGRSEHCTNPMFVRKSTHNKNCTEYNEPRTREPREKPCTKQRFVREARKKKHELALNNRAGGLYGRILTEVESTGRTQWCRYTRPRSSFSHTDRLSSVNEMFIIWCSGFVPTGILLENGDKFARPLYFFLISFLSLTEINIVRWK